jgi:hypothetical protein
MRRKISIILVVLIAAIPALGQNADPACQRVDGARDSLFIESVRVDMISQLGGPLQRSVVLRLKNNSTCAVLLTTTDVTNFVEKLGPSPTARQLREQKFRNIINDGEFVSGLQLFTDINFGDSTLTTRTNSDGDVSFELSLTGTRSLLFAVSVENLKKGQLILVPFKFEWESKPGKHRSNQFTFSGETHHLVWFSYANLPKEVLAEIRE